MEPLEYLDHVTADVALFLDAARTAGVDAAVPTCPDWTVADLARHQGRVYRWMCQLLETEAQNYVSPKEIAAQAEREDPIAWLEEGATQALDYFGSADPETQVWNWVDGRPGPARFWYRRMAHETVIHRIDAEAAAGRTPAPVEPAEFASDGIDEFLQFLPVRAARGASIPLTGSYHFHSTDVPGEWVVAFPDGTIEVRREHAKADTAVRGPASDLELFLYNRRNAEGLEIFGDPARMTAWSEAIKF
ncbi:MAG TPA: maleylpyruvate isomerase family mycothiol-dependent enzyme [Acidimicrobiia bacterium]|nr:maleylpyruvate isomerase family mycothiol-dependent enzyme [Acidimicrobiia bacterium]